MSLISEDKGKNMEGTNDNVHITTNTNKGLKALDLDNKVESLDDLLLSVPTRLPLSYSVQTLAQEHN